MRNALQLTGFVLVLQGISGAIDHCVQLHETPANLFNRFVSPVEVLADHALFANLVPQE